MKKIFMLLSIVLVGNILINSCIYDKVCEGEASIITPPDKPDTVIVVPPTLSKKITFRFIPDESLDSTYIKTYAAPYINFLNNNNIVALRWGNTENIGVFLIGSDGTPLLPDNTKFDYLSSQTFYEKTISTSLTSAIAYGYTPYQSTNSGTNVSYILNNIQDQSATNSTENTMDNVLSSNVFTVASPVTSSFISNIAEYNMTFKSIFAFLRFQVKKAPTYDSFNLQKIVSVKLYVADTLSENVISDYSLAGSYKIDVTKAPGMSGYSGPVFESHSKEITANVSGGDFISELSNSPYIWFVINPIKIKPSEKLISIIETTSKYRIISKYDISEIKPNCIYTSIIEANEMNTVSSQIIELSNGRPSNCHIVSSAGIYRLYLKTISGVSLTGNSVDWVWASKEGGSSSFDINELIDAESISYNASGGYVDFRVGSSLGKFNKGNVILALKDASGNIVWTWHIWITDKPEDMVYDNGSAFMDRNLGALSTDINSPAVDTYGFVYQWGRKDPFFGGDGVTYDEAEGVFSTARAHTIINNSAGTWNTDVDKWTYKAGSPTTGFLDYIKQYPMQFIYNQGSGPSWKKTPADWLFTSNSSLWSATLKTDYDPCPNGYRVPSANEIHILQAANVTGAFNQYSEKYWKYNSSIVSYWPAAGMRQGRQNISSGIYGTQLKYSATDMLEGQCYYWTSTPFSVGGTMVSGASYRIHTVSDKLYSDDEYGDNADAYPIRCVKE